jgi:hypothetical protein
MRRPERRTQPPRTAVLNARQGEAGTEQADLLTSEAKPERADKAAEPPG